MKTASWIYLAILLVIILVAAAIALTPTVYRGHTANFYSGTNYRIEVEGSDDGVHVTGLADDYFRLTNGQDELLATPIFDSYHVEGDLQGGDWYFNEGTKVHLHLEANDMMTVTKIPVAGAWIDTTRIGLLAFLLVGLLGVATIELRCE